jgi:integrase/recombinase XerD
MERALARYLRHHKAKNSSPKTVAYYQEAVGRSLARFLRDRGHSLKLEDLTQDDVLDWIDDQRSRNLSQKTVHTRVIAVKAFTRWCVEEEWLPKDPLAKLKRPQVDDVPKQTLTPEQVDTLLRSCDRSTLLGVRDFAMLLTLYSTGVRASELANLTTGDVDWNRGLITIRRGKGGKFRVVPLGSKVDKSLDKYLSHPQRPDQDHLFLTQAGTPINYKTMHSLLQRVERHTGIHCNAHTFRHTAAITYLRNGGRVETLRAMLGHTTMEMTLHYARIAGVDLSAAHETADPARSLKVRV